MSVSGLETTQTFGNAYDATMWTKRADGGYRQLGWAHSTDLLTAIRQIAEVTSNDRVLDVAAGTGAVTRALAEFVSEVYAFDISPQMLSNMPEVPNNAHLKVADATKLPYRSESFDLVTARMVYHHLTSAQISQTVAESLRVLKPGGKLMVIEYVPQDETAQKFEEGVFSIKEQGRHLWTGEQLQQELKTTVLGQPNLEEAQIEVAYATLSQYSVVNWIEKSGLSRSEKDAIYTIYANAPTEVRETMNMTFLNGHNRPQDDVWLDKDRAISDVLVDRPFAHVKIVKPAKR